MNFGDILEQFEKSQKQKKLRQNQAHKIASQKPAGSGKKLNADFITEQILASQKAIADETYSQNNKNAKNNASKQQNSSPAITSIDKNGMRAKIDAKNAPANKGTSTKKTQTQARVNPMDVWLRKYGVTDKDKIEQQRIQQEKMQDPSVLKNMAAEAEIDLHGLTQDEAWERLDLFITECVRRGLRKVLIIHGKGNHSSTGPVLARLVHNFIEQDYRLGSSGHPARIEGGRGATWVIIRPNAKNE